MDCVNSVRQIVNVTAYYFRGDNQPECYPKRMEYHDQNIDFNEDGQRHPALKGRHLIQVFDMTDGQANYRLEFDTATLGWTLLSVTENSYQPGSFISLAGLNYAARA